MTGIRSWTAAVKALGVVQVACTLRVRKGPSDGTAEESAKKFTTGVESAGSARVLKA